VEAIGPVLVLLSIPLMLRWIPPNRIYGFRIPATLRNRSVWYDANALCARHFTVLGLILVTLIIVVDWRTANRWERERMRAR
jgi:hypothetical protein